MPMLVVAVLGTVGGPGPVARAGTLLAGVIVGGWLVAGIVWLAAVARRASTRLSRPAPRRRRRRSGTGGGPERGRLVLALLGLSATAVPFLLEGWSGWPWVVGNLVLLGFGLAAARLGANGTILTQRLVMFLVVVCLAGAGFAVAVVWGRLFLLGAAGAAFAICLAALAAILLLGLFAVTVTEAAARTLAWCRRGGAGRWLAIAAVCAVTLVLPAVAGLPWWLGPPGVMLLAASVGMLQIGEAEGGDGHVLSMLSGVAGGAYLVLILVSFVESWQRHV